MSSESLSLPESFQRLLTAGHPWLYRDRVPPGFSAPDGTVVRVIAGRASAYGVWDADSPIAIRLFSREAPPDEAWVGLRVRDALDLRARLLPERTDALRVVNGEGDGLPGIVVDRYGAFLVVRAESPSLDALVRHVAHALVREAPGCEALGCAAPRAVIWRHRDTAPEALHGKLPHGPTIVEENGIRFSVDMLEGQKTGLFLDHRDNRRFVGDVSGACRVLNLFAYTGGFSLYAARGGAQSVISVDSAAPAADVARESFRINGLGSVEHEFEVADVYEFLARARAADRRYDVVVCDPPSFARRNEQKKRALAAYARLNAAAMQVVSRGGLFATASCTAYVSPEDFRGVLASASRRARCSFQILRETGHAFDHPVLAAHPEGRYLKFVVGRVLR